MSNMRPFTGTLIGKPFMVSVDRTGARSNKNECAYIVSDYKVPTGYSAYLVGATFPVEYVHNLSTYCPEASILYGVDGLDELCNYDVIEVNSQGFITRVYRASSTDNVLFVTNKCNSNCIMCPDSDYNRKQDLGDRIAWLTRLVNLLPSDVPHLTITGGEPTLLKWDFLNLLSLCKEKLPTTEFLMLSNARSLSAEDYRNAFIDAIPLSFRLAVPIYAAEAERHDSITRAYGSFEQTICALKHLQHKVLLEIRIVVMENNYRQLPQIANFIVDEIPQAATVSLMGMELLGNAAVNRDLLWVDYKETASYVEQAVYILLKAGIDARIYNYPLCCLPGHLWSIATKSITDYKVRFKEKCAKCAVKEACGGFFFSTINYEKVSVFPVQEN